MIIRWLYSIREYCTCFLSTFGPWLSGGYMQELHLFLIPIWAMINRWLYTRFALVSYQHLGHDYQVVICENCTCFLSPFGPWLTGGFTPVLRLFLINIWAMIIRWLYTSIALVSYQHLGHDYQVVIQHTRVLHLFLINIWAMIIRWLYASIALVSYQHLGHDTQVVIWEYCSCF